MAFMRNNLVSRAGYSGVGDFWDDISAVAGGALKFYGSAAQAQGAAAATAQTNKDLAAALAANQGIGTGTIVLLGVVGLGAFLLLRKPS